MSVVHVGRDESDGFDAEPSFDQVTSDTKLRLMRPRRLTCLVAALTIAASCSSRDATDDAPPAAVSGDSAVAESAVPWFEGAAPLLLVPADSSGRALVVLADSQASDLEDGVLAQPAALVGLDGSVSRVRVSLSSEGEGCVDAALDPAPALGWGVGFIGVAPAALRVDSLRSLSRADSSLLAPIVFRLASAVPNVPGGRFAGLPFTLIDLWRVHLVDGTIVLVASTKRQINQEDSPLEERTLLVAEADNASEFTLVHAARSSGAEETVEAVMLLAAVTMAEAKPILVLSHDYGEETSYSILERTGRRAWKVRWASRRFSC